MFDTITLKIKQKQGLVGKSKICIKCKTDPDFVGGT